MKKTLPNALLAGLIATTFAIVNCQKAPSRSVKADTDKDATQKAVKITACGDEIVAELKKTSESVDNTQKALDAVKNVETKDLTAEQKANLKKLVTDMDAQNKKLMALMDKLAPVGEKKEKACTVKDKEGKDVPQVPDVITKKVTDLAKAVKDKTGEANIVTDEAPLKNGTVKLAKELSDLLSDASNSKDVVISSGKIEKGEAGKAAAAKKDLTSCMITSTVTEKIKDNAVLALIISQDEADPSTVEIALEIKVDDQGGSASAGLTCKLAENKTDAGKELRKALGKLVTEVTLPPPPPPAKPKSQDISQGSGDATQGSGDTTPASGDPSSGDSTKATKSASLAELEALISKLRG